MKKFSKSEIYIYSSVGGILIILLSLFCVFACLFAKKVSEINNLKSIVYVCVDDELFKKYCSELSEEKISDIITDKKTKKNKTIKLVSKSNFINNILSENPLSLCGATVEKNTSFNFSGLPENSENEKYFLISKNNYLPCVVSDFSSDVKINDPGVTVSISSSENMPENCRALKVDGKYAGEENYALEQKVYAQCNVILTSYNNEIFKLCENIFKSENISKNRESPVFIASVGDIMVARGAEEVLINDKKGLEKIFGRTLSILQNNDLTIGNLEGVVTTNTKNATKTYTFKFRKAVLEPLKKAGFNYFMQTNNHCYDYGEEGFKDTLAALQEYGIPTSGVGKNAEEAAKFYHTEIEGVKFAIISCGAYPVERSGFNGEKTATATESRAGILWQNEKLFEDIKKEKAAGNFVIVNIHGGEEYQFVPNKKQRALYEKLIDSGASVVFGSHPHVLQPTEWYNDGLIVYSMGNFVFNGMEGMYGATESEIVRLGLLNGKIAYVEIYPAKLSGYTVDLK